VRCGKGTYIRVLAADLGAALGCGGALASLVRTRVGPYSLEEAVAWSDLRDARHGALLWERVQPGDSALVSLAAMTLDPAGAALFLHGHAVDVPASDGLVRVYGAAGLFLGVGLARAGRVKPERLIHVDAARPRVLPA
jgi:tRNA pseudouridine55 synthase